jgi:hypothetical protein
VEPHYAGFQRQRNARMLRYAAKLAILAMKSRELLAGREYPVSSADLRPRVTARMISRSSIRWSAGTK